jgi:hypothetical protein
MNSFLKAGGDQRYGRFAPIRTTFPWQSGRGRSRPVNGRPMKSLWPSCRWSGARLSCWTLSAMPASSPPPPGARNGAWSNRNRSGVRHPRRLRRLLRPRHEHSCGVEAQDHASSRVEDESVVVRVPGDRPGRRSRRPQSRIRCAARIPPSCRDGSRPRSPLQRPEKSH